MDELVRFLRARLDEDEKRLWHMRKQVIDRPWSAFPYDAGGWRIGIPNGQDGFVVARGMEQAAAEHIVVAADPARVLRDIEAKRAIVNEYAEVASNDTDGAYEYAVGWANALGTAARQLASVYADHPEFQDAWRP
ncbi:DUF6221 family protein [Streptomyces sp. NPDC051016]|uniref:DUF6221 family protein n=1 Tax=Streptomyces sp. NPDC051016 TaxID=3365638 RepID=UPI0037A61881